MYDINLYPLKLHQGQQEFTFSGFKAAASPRYSARSRSEDFLIVSLSLRGDASISNEIQQSWLDDLIGAFFKISGSVTSAMRTVIETLNLTLMEKNLQSVRDEGAVIGGINLAAIHRRVLYITQTGHAHAFALNQGGLAHFFDTSLSDRGLGFSRSPYIRYYQAEIGREVYFFTTDSPPETWREDLLFSGEFPTLEQLRRRLLNQAPQEFRIDLSHIAPGEGRIHVEKSRTVTSSAAAESVELHEEAAAHPVISSEPIDDDVFDTKKTTLLSSLEENEPAQAGQDEAFVDVVDKTESEEKASVDVELKGKSSAEGQPIRKERIKRPEASEVSAEMPQGEKEIKGAEHKIKFVERQQIKSRSFKGLATVFSAWHSICEKSDTFFRDLISRWTRSESGERPKLSRGTLLFIAIAVPLVVVGIAAGVYFARGRTLQYQYYLEQAQAASNLATSLEDPNQSRTAWNQALEYINQAEDYKETDQIVALREQALDALDELDGAVRLAYQPAIVGSLISGIKITDIISYGPDLYLLDSAGGRVIHAERGGQGYTVDPDFVCAAGNYSGGSIEALVDMVSLPINNTYQAHILAVDAMGNSVYCAPDQNPVVQSLPSASGISGGITHIAFDSNFLYALVPSSGIILVYRPTNGQYLETPTGFFEGLDFAEIPNLSRVVDIAVNGPELYLLQMDGKLVDCTSRGVAGVPVSCENPVEYIDGRTGKEDQIFTMPESNYSTILYAAPPDPSINILDIENADVYRFSLRFRLHKRLRPDMDDFEVGTANATAFTIGIDRVAFIAFGNQVFYAYIE